MEASLDATEREPVHAVQIDLAFTQINCLSDEVFKIDWCKETFYVIIPWVYDVFKVKFEKTIHQDVFDLTVCKPPFNIFRACAFLSVYAQI